MCWFFWPPAVKERGFFIPMDLIIHVINWSEILIIW